MLKNRFYFFFAVLSITTASFCSYGQILERTKCENGKYGLQDIRTSKWVVYCKYDKFIWFNFKGTKMASVKFNGRWGCIDENGVEIVPTKHKFRDEAEAEAKAQVRNAMRMAIREINVLELQEWTEESQCKNEISTTNAHDVITMLNGYEIQAKITEVSTSDIKYKRFDNLEGPTFVILRKDVFAINYTNGTRDVINPINATNKGRTVGEPQSQSKLGLQGGVNFPEGGYLNLFNNYTNGEHYVKSKTGFQIGLITDMPFKNQQFGFQPVLSFFQLGLEFGNKGHNPWKSEVKMNFIQVRGNLRYKIGQSDTSLSLQTGPFFNYPLHYKKIDDGKAVESELTEKGLSDFGVGLGAALVFGGRVQLCGGYNIGVKVNYTTLNLTVYMFGN